MEAKAFEEYGEMLVELVGLRPRQGLVIKSEPVNWPVLLAIAEAAYRRGAKYVQPVVESTALHRVRVENSPEEPLEFVPNSRTAWQEQFVEEGWAIISLKTPDDPDIYAGIDTERHGKVTTALRKSDHPWRSKLMNDENQWLIAPAPAARWAAKVLDSKPSREAQTKLWQLLKPILRLDTADPAAFWREQSELLHRRAQILNALSLRQLHFEAPGTDLTVGLREEALWTGGASETPEGVRFMPNIPTEEVFTAPDRAATEGTVAVTRPVMVLGDLVEGAEFQFEAGRVVAARAKRGEETLKRYLEVDEGSRRLGEVALVDGSSPIYRGGYLFYNTLLDENAACHIALGAAYPDCLRGGERMSREELSAKGANQSLQHDDFMIGSESIDVTGIDGQGSPVPIMKSGMFVLEEVNE